VGETPGKPVSLPSSWRDQHDQPVLRPDVPDANEIPFYVPIGAFQGDTYEKNAFAKHTEHEVAWLWDILGLTAGMRLLDIGCGTGRHMRALAGRGIDVVGVDVSGELIAAGEQAVAREQVEASVTFHHGDATTVLAEVLATERFDVVMSLHQGALGISVDGDRQMLAAAMSRLQPGGVFVATFFHALFAARHLVGDDAYDPMNGVHHQVSEVYGNERQMRRFDLWTTAYTVREAVGLVQQAGLTLRDVHGVEPGAFTKRDAFTVGLDDPEFVVVAQR